MRHHSFRTAMFYGGLGPRHYLRARSPSSALFSSMPSVTHSRLLAIGHPTRCRPPQSLDHQLSDCGIEKKKNCFAVSSTSLSSASLCSDNLFSVHPPLRLLHSDSVRDSTRRLTSHVTTALCGGHMSHRIPVWSARTLGPRFLAFRTRSRS